MIKVNLRWGPWHKRYRGRGGSKGRGRLKSAQHVGHLNGIVRRVQQIQNVPGNLRVASGASMESRHAGAVVWVLPVFVKVESQVGRVTFGGSSKTEFDNPDNKHIVSRDCLFKNSL